MKCMVYFMFIPHCRVFIIPLYFYKRVIDDNRNYVCVAIL